MLTNHIVFLASFILILEAVTLSAQESNPTFRADQYMLDLRAEEWQYVAEADPKKMETPESLRPRTDWAPIRVGESWDRAGHEELRPKVVWLRIRVFIPPELRGDRISFFVTAIGGAAEVFFNGKAVGKAQYKWMSHVHGPTRIEVTDAARHGEPNELLVRCDPKGSARSVGLLGLVCFCRTIPFARTPEGGIAVQGGGDGPFSVLLHYGDALLCRGEQTAFSADELRALRLPAYALREDEMVLAAPAKAVAAVKRLHIDAAVIHHTTDDRPLSVRCERLPESVKQFERLTVPLQVTGRYRNPFDPKVIDVMAAIRTPSGKEETVHAFFAQDYAPVGVGENQEILRPERGVGTPWRIYYRPRQAGRHEVRLVARAGSEEARFDAGCFEAQPQKHRCYLRVSRNDPRFFEFDDGESFFATGPGGWFRQMQNWMFGGNTRWIPIAAHMKYYERKGRNRSSYEYLARWHFGRLDLDNGLIDAYVAWKLEAAVRAMEANGIHWITYGLPGGGRAVYNGSPQSFESAGRIQLFHEVSRFADSPALWIWNCAEETAANPWMVPYHEYIRSLDIYRHPHAVGEYHRPKKDGSAAPPAAEPEPVKLGSDVLLLPGWYGFSLEKCIATYEPLADLRYPIVDTEGSLGGGATAHLYQYRDKVDAIAQGYHNHLWLCLFMKLAAGGTEWGNSELDAADRFFHAAALARFIENEQLANGKWERVAPAISDASLRAFGLRSPGKTLVWIVRPDGGKSGPVTLGIPVSGDGHHRVEIWDTRRGEAPNASAADSDKGILTVELPEVAGDQALKAIAGKP